MILNFFINDSESSYEILKTKISMIVNKSINDFPIRALIETQKGSDEPRRQFNCANECIYIEYDPASTLFWEKKYLFRFLNFMNNSNELYHKHCLISKLVIDIPDEPEYQCMFADISTRVEFMDEVYDQIVTILDTSIEKDKIVNYDTSIFYIDDEFKIPIIRMLKKIVDEYPGWIDPNKANTILSVCVAIIQSELGMTIGHAGITSHDISHGDVLDFYHI